MIQYNFKGSHFEVGKALGEIYLKDGKKFKFPKKNLIILEKQIEIYKKHYPLYLKFLEGISEGLKCDKNDIFYFFLAESLANEIGDIVKGCTIFGVNKKDNFYVGRNYDWNQCIEKIFGIYKMSFNDSFSHISVSDMEIDNLKMLSKKNMFFSPDDIINEKGLFIGLTYAFHKNKINYGISPVKIQQLIAEKCETIEEAIDIFKKVPLSFPKNFFVADRFGNQVVVENTVEKVKFIYPNKDGVLIKTNHFIDDDLKNEEEVLNRYPMHNTFLRYYETLRNINLNLKKFNFNHISKILRKKDSYTFQKQSYLYTIRTLALDLKNGKYEITYGKNKKIELKFDEK